MSAPPSGLSKGQIKAIDVAERVSSAFSLIGVSFIISTFLLTHKFRRPMNRLIFFASFGNCFGNIATLIGRGGIASLEGKKSSPLCTFQAFLLQALAMAINVYFTVIHKFEALRLRKLEPYYVAACYLLPGIIGFTYLFINVAPRGPVYGNAVLWCWVSADWDILRITTFYGPVWIVILVTCVLYACTGRVILKLRKSLRMFRQEERTRMSEQRCGSEQGLKNNAAQPAIQKTTETHVEISSPQQKPTGMITDLSAPPILPPGAIPGADDTYKISIGASQIKDEILEDPEFEARAPPPVDVEKFGPINQNNHHAMRKLRTTMRANAAAWAYARCAMLFFIGLIITWLPSSMNRVYSYVHNDTNFVLGFLSALVLPSQGFWNSIIYICTSWRSCCKLWSDIRFHLQGRHANPLRCVTKHESASTLELEDDYEEEIY